MTRPFLQGRSIGMVLLSIYLILVGLALLLGLTFVGFPLLQGGLALIAGICLLVGR